VKVSLAGIYISTSEAYRSSKESVDCRKRLLTSSEEKTWLDLAVDKDRGRAVRIS